METRSPDVVGVPGDFSPVTETVTGQVNITIPGIGEVVLNAGRTVTAPDGSIDFRARPQDFLDYSRGNTDVVTSLRRPRRDRLRRKPDPRLVDYRKLVPVSFSIFMVLAAFGVMLILADIVNPVSVA
jgi:hypothetical protein